jgi:hypothetical protein
MKQNDFMAVLHFLSDDDAFTTSAYADAEKRGIIARGSNVHNLSPEDYAHRLLTDGKNKGWLETKRQQLAQHFPNKEI